MTQSEKSTKQAMLDQQINKLQLQIANLQKQKEQLNKQTTVQEFKLSSIAKAMMEEPDPENAPDTGDSDEPKEKEPSTDNSNLQVKFNMTKVKKYNKYPVVDNTGTVTGVSKEGVTAKVGDNTIFINYNDILS